jgi:hypothetical protein
MSVVTRYQERGWSTAPISPTCETLGLPGARPRQCGQPTSHAYPALRGGWAAICEHHAVNILPHCTPIVGLLAVAR